MGKIHRRHMWDASSHNPKEDAPKNKHPTWKKGWETGKLRGILVAKQLAFCTTHLSLQRALKTNETQVGSLSCS